jgi:RNA polymerase sigma-70 factor (TIGR02960 family)
MRQSMTNPDLDQDEFRALVEPHRRELQVHCYRMLGSVQDAEDLVQETLLAAWRGLDGFRGESGVRPWLYRIATNMSLNELRRRGRRPNTGDSVWLEPYPDALLEGLPDRSEAPDARYDTREAIELAFVAALQHLPPRQRVVLVLRDVLGFRAAEVAEILGSSVASANGALRRARKALEERRPSGERARPAPGAERELVGRFVDAFERGDVDAVVALLTEDARLVMPPEPFEHRGRAAIGHFLATVPAGGELHRIRLVATRANGQPAFGCYLRESSGPRMHAYGLMVLTVARGGVAGITGFADTSVFPHFGLPRTLRD